MVEPTKVYQTDGAEIPRRTIIFKRYDPKNPPAYILTYHAKGSSMHALQDRVAFSSVPSPVVDPPLSKHMKRMDDTAAIYVPNVINN